MVATCVVNVAISTRLLNWKEQCRGIQLPKVAYPHQRTITTVKTGNHDSTINTGTEGAGAIEAEI